MKFDFDMGLSVKERNRLLHQYGPWAIVTGASSGIGRELSVKLAASGLHLILTARRKNLLDQLASELEATHKIQTKTVVADQANPMGVAAVIKAAEGLEVGLLVVAAGFGTSGHFHESKLDVEKNMLQVNCTALLEVTHHFSRQFVKNKRGGIILLSSMVGFQGVPFAANYAATKAYVQSLGEALHVELKPYGVDVLATAPGPVKSGFEGRANMQMNMSMSPAQVAVPILKALGRKSTNLPGFLTKFLVSSLRTVPRWGKVRIMKLVMGGMTQHQRA
ncbi:MAG: SDR family NAD(P)-dependent oxidoreductase [Bacteroidota bacterium]